MDEKGCQIAFIDVQDRTQTDNFIPFSCCFPLENSLFTLTFSSKSDLSSRMRHVGDHAALLLLPFYLQGPGTDPHQPITDPGCPLINQSQCSLSPDPSCAVAQVRPIRDEYYLYRPTQVEYLARPSPPRQLREFGGAVSTNHRGVLIV